MTKPIRPAKYIQPSIAQATGHPPPTTTTVQKPAPYIPATSPIILNAQGRPVDIQGIEKVSVESAIVLDSHGDPIKTSTGAIETAVSFSAGLDFSAKYFALAALTKQTGIERFPAGPFSISDRGTRPQQELLEWSSVLSWYLPRPIQGLAQRFRQSKIANLKETALLGGQIGAGIALLLAGQPAAATLFLLAAATNIHSAAHSMGQQKTPFAGKSVTQMAPPVPPTQTFKAEKQTKSLPPRPAGKQTRQGPPLPGKKIREAIIERKARERNYAKSQKRK